MAYSITLENVNDIANEYLLSFNQTIKEQNLVYSSVDLILTVHESHSSAHLFGAAIGMIFECGGKKYYYKTDCINGKYQHSIPRINWAEAELVLEAMKKLI